MMNMLNTGSLLPLVGYGTGGEGKSTPEELYTAIRIAIDAGYRLIDTSMIYENEHIVGAAIRDSQVPRSDMFVITKLWPTYMREPHLALDMSLERLQLDYVDCYLLHWPIPLQSVPGEPYALGDTWDRGWDLAQTWAEMQKLSTSKTRAIGLCNCSKVRLQLLLNRPTTKVIPAILQIEGHPELPQWDLLNFCSSLGIRVLCYSPLAQGQVSNPVIRNIAEKHNVDAACIAISWGVKRGTSVLPKSMNPSRIRSNINLVDLDNEDLRNLALLAETPRRIINPRILFGIDIFDDNN